MNKTLIFNTLLVAQLAIVTMLFLGFDCRAAGAVGGGESRLNLQVSPLQPLNLTLRSALAARSSIRRT